MRRDLAPLRPATVCVCDDPMQTFIRPDQVRAARDGETLADMVPNRPGRWLCMVNDRLIPPELWHYMPRPESFVQIRAVAEGGDDNGGGSRAILTIIAIIAINYFTAGMGSGWTASLYRVGLTIAANALINNLVPLQQQGAGANSYNARPANNIARLGQPIPECFGFNNGFPDLAAQPYNFYTRTQQTLHLVLCLGEGQHHICRVSNGDTDLRNYDDIEMVRVGPGQSTMDGPGTGVENLADQTLVDPRWVTSQDANLVEMRPGQPAGPFTVCGRERTVDSIGIDLVQPRGMSQEVRMRWRHEAQLIDDFEQPLADWFVLGSHTTTNEHSNPHYFQHDYEVKPGRYWVRMIRTDEIGRDLEDIDQLSVLAVRGHVVDGDINVSGCTFICIKARVTGQINGSLRFRVMHYRMLPVWDGAAWSAPQITRNPAWAFAQVPRARGVPDSRIDLTQLAALAATWAARYDSFDYRFDTQISMWEAMAMIARVGRAVPLVRGSRYTVVRDEARALPVAFYGMRNIVRGTVQIKPALAQSDKMRTLDLEYLDHRHDSPITVTAQIHNRVVYGYRGDAQRIALGLPEPDANLRGRVPGGFPGIIGFNHAMRTVVYTLADRYYRPYDVEYDTELDGELPAVLDLVTFQHDIGNFGSGGDLVSWDEGTLTLTTTEPLPWGDGSHGMRLQYQTGAMTAAIPVTRGADDYTAVLAFLPPPVPGTSPPIDFVFRTDDADRERTKYVFGPTQQVGALAKVKSMMPQKQNRIGMRLVLEDDRVHSVDAKWIAPDELPPCVVEEVESYYFRDEFNGPPGSLVGHDPDEAPPGFVWGSGSCVLTGSGSVTAFEAGHRGENFAAINPPLPFFIEMTGTRPELLGSEGDQFSIGSGGLQCSVALRNQSELSATIDAVFIAVGGTYTEENIGPGPHSLRLRFNVDGTATAILDGTEVQTFTGGPPTGGFNLIEIYCSVSDGPGDTLLQGVIDRVAIQPT